MNIYILAKAFKDERHERVGTLHDPKIWEQGTNLHRLLSYYLPQQKREAQVTINGLMSLALLYCAGTTQEKVKTIDDMLNYKHNIISDEFKCSTFELQKIIECIMEFIVIRKVLFRDKIEPFGPEYKLKISRSKVMIKKLTMGESPKVEYRGFFTSIFSDGNTVVKKDFLKKMKDPTCSWIFDAKKIESKLNKIRLGLHLQEVMNGNVPLNKNAMKGKEPEDKDL